MRWPTPLLPLALTLLPVSALAQAPSWTVDPAASRLGFQARQQGAQFDATFQRWSAEIALDPAAPAGGRILATIDMTSAVTGNAERDQSMQATEWFDAATHPAARFESTDIVQTGPGAYTARGTLALKGVAKPVELPFTLALDGPTARAQGQVTLARADWGVGNGEWGQSDIIGPQVVVTIDLTATRAP